MLFQIDYFALGLLVVAALLLVFLRRLISFETSTPSLAFSRLQDLNISSWRSRLAKYPKRLHIAALVLFLLAFIDPHFLFLKSSLTHQKKQPLHELPTEGIAIYLDLDRSGSMKESVEAISPSGNPIMTPKIDLLKEVTKQFILEHPSDLIGIATFARVPRVIVPLTLDQRALLQKLDQIEVVQDPNDDGTAIGYAIFKTANLIAATKHFANDLRKDGKPPYTIKGSAIIVVTDGFQDPSRLDYGNRLRTLELDDAAAYVKSQGIHLYVINIDPALASAQFAPQRRQLEKVTSSTGGKFYLTGGSQDLKSIYEDISRLEKGTIQREAQLQNLNPKRDYSRFSLYPILIAIGLSLIFSSVMLETLFLKGVP